MSMTRRRGERRRRAARTAASGSSALSRAMAQRLAGVAVAVDLVLHAGVLEAEQRRVAHHDDAADRRRQRLPRRGVAARRASRARSRPARPRPRPRRAVRRTACGSPDGARASAAPASFQRAHLRTRLAGSSSGAARDTGQPLVVIEMPLHRLRCATCSSAAAPVRRVAVAEQRDRRAAVGLGHAEAARAQLAAGLDRRARRVRRQQRLVGTRHDAAIQARVAAGPARIARGGAEAALTRLRRRRRPDRQRQLAAVGQPVLDEARAAADLPAVAPGHERQKLRVDTRADGRRARPQHGARQLADAELRAALAEQRVAQAQLRLRVRVRHDAQPPAGLRRQRVAQPDAQPARVGRHDVRGIPRPVGRELQRDAHRSRPARGSPWRDPAASSGRSGRCAPRSRAAAPPRGTDAGPAHAPITMSRAQAHATATKAR